MLQLSILDRRFAAALTLLAVSAWGAGCSRAQPGLVDTLSRLPGDLAFVARVESAPLGGSAAVAGALAAMASRVGGVEQVPVRGLLATASAVTAIRGPNVTSDPRCVDAAAHVAGLMRASAGGHEPEAGDVAATRRACEHLGLADCLLAARSENEAVACATARTAAGEPWAFFVDGVSDSEAAAVAFAGALGLRVHPEAPRYADARRAVHALPGRLLVGQPALVRALAAALTGPAVPRPDDAFQRLARELPSGAAVQAVYRGLGTPPSLEAAALAVSLDGGVAVSWRLDGGPSLAGELRTQLDALRAQAEAQAGPWSAALAAAVPVTPSDAAALIQAVSVLAGGASLASRPGGVAVTARAPVDLAAIVARLGATERPRGDATPAR